MSASQKDAAWRQFGELLGRPARAGFDTPRPSITWDISSFYICNKDHQKSIEEDLRLKTLTALRECTTPGEELLALDYNHTCFYFAPHGGISDGLPHSWGMDVLPAGEEYNFIAQDYRFGIIGNTVSHTLCVFGRELLSAFQRNAPLIFTTPTWTVEEHERMERIWVNKGWRILSDDRSYQVWEQFDDKFGFHERNNSSGCPAIIEPSPSVTWSISEDFSSPGSSIQLNADDLTLKLLAALKSVARSGERLYALDSRFMPRIRTFAPHRINSANRESWALPVWSTDKYSILAGENFRFGVFGNPAESTICVFGQSLIDAIRGDPPLAFGPIIRQHGIA